MRQRWRSEACLGAFASPLLWPTFASVWALREHRTHDPDSTSQIGRNVHVQKLYISVKYTTSRRCEDGVRETRCVVSRHLVASFLRGSLVLPHLRKGTLALATRRTKRKKKLETRTLKKFRRSTILIPRQAVRSKLCNSWHESRIVNTPSSVDSASGTLRLIYELKRACKLRVGNFERLERRASRNERSCIVIHAGIR